MNLYITISQLRSTSTSEYFHFLCLSLSIHLSIYLSSLPIRLSLSPGCYSGKSQAACTCTIPLVRWGLNPPLNIYTLSLFPSIYLSIPLSIYLPICLPFFHQVVRKVSHKLDAPARSQWPSESCIHLPLDQVISGNSLAFLSSLNRGSHERV